MSLDRTTESIAHFVGLLHMAVEDTRLRDQYIEFKHAKDDHGDGADLEFKPVRIAAGLELDDYSAKVKYSGTPEVQQPGLGQGLPPLPAIVQNIAAGSFRSPERLPESLITGPTGAAGGYTILPYVPFPPQTITVTLQSITLIDNDTLGDPAAAGFLPRDVLLAELNELIALSEALQPWSVQGLAAAVIDDPEAAIAYIRTLEEVDAPEGPHFTAHVLRDADATGIVMNGVSLPEPPETDVFLPAFIQLKRDEDPEEEADADVPPDRPLAGLSKDPAKLHEDGDDFPQYAGIDHNVVTGANESHNAASIYTNWIDAAVFAVAGNSVAVKAISQTNILFDQDINSAGLTKFGPAASQANNIAAIDPEKNIAESEEDTEDQGETDENAPELPAAIEDGLAASEDAAADALDEDLQQAGGASGRPVIWNLETVDGDVTFTNIVKQHNFVSDTDQLNLTFTANSTTVSTGENLTFNQLQADEYGFGYDLVLVGGSMTTMNVINQTNVLLDNDHFSGAGLHQAVVSGNDNSLVNDAAITTQGVDTQQAMLDDFKTAIDDLAAGAKQLADTVAQHALFEGMEALRALYIKGDLTQLNIIDQINTIGDQDQVHMAAEAMKSAIDNMPVAITTGSNYLTNSASIEQDGVDSTIMAGGDHYSDAMLYQAELIDTDANPLGVNITQLANEAIAMLVHEQINEIAQAALGQDTGNLDLHTGGTSLDVMQTMTG